MTSEQSDNEVLWRELLTGEGSSMATQRRRNRRLPGSPRCKTCLHPLGGPLAPVLRIVTHRTRSAMNPNYCNLCGASLPVGAGVHTGTAYVGAVGSDGTVTDFTALGAAVNVAARLSGLAAVGECS